MWVMRRNGEPTIEAAAGSEFEGKRGTGNHQDEVMPRYGKQLMMQWRVGDREQGTGVMRRRHGWRTVERPTGGDAKGGRGAGVEGHEAGLGGGEEAVQDGKAVAGRAAPLMARPTIHVKAECRCAGSTASWSS